MYPLKLLEDFSLLTIPPCTLRASYYADPRVNQVETAQDPAWDVQFEAVYSAQPLLNVPWLMVSFFFAHIGSAARVCTFVFCRTAMKEEVLTACVTVLLGTMTMRFSPASRPARGVTKEGYNTVHRCWEIVSARNDPEKNVYMDCRWRFV